MLASAVHLKRQDFTTRRHHGLLTQIDRETIAFGYGTLAEQPLNHRSIEHDGQNTIL